MGMAAWMDTIAGWDWLVAIHDCMGMDGQKQRNIT
jgi:hypothetical protein